MVPYERRRSVADKQTAAGQEWTKMVGYALLAFLILTSPCLAEQGWVDGGRYYVDIGAAPEDWPVSDRVIWSDLQSCMPYRADGYRPDGKPGVVYSRGMQDWCDKIQAQFDDVSRTLFARDAHSDDYSH
jgi:hypothetical protein